MWLLGNTYLRQEKRVVHENPVHAFLVFVEITHLLAEGVDFDRSVPRAFVLVVPG